MTLFVGHSSETLAMAVWTSVTGILVARLDALFKHSSETVTMAGVKALAEHFSDTLALTAWQSTR